MNSRVIFHLGFLFILALNCKGFAEEEAKVWAFTTPQTSTPPVVTASEWMRNEIDAFVLGRLEAAGLEPAEEASRQTLIRRVYFDLIGLPPTPEQVAAFINDADAEAYAKVVNRIQKDARYVERWARFWLALAR